ncbi:MAG: ABC transporter permease subunit [Clostridium sp.]|uniref:ABC transporter permease subunit n=1 Tax=Clostridium sp. TaxID=1506 RepID=UPI00306C69D7
MKKINFPLLLGSIIVIFLGVVALWPGFFTDKDPLFEESPKYIEYKDKGAWAEKFAYNPMQPNKDNIFGTDDAGRDVYSRLVYGTRNTLKLAFLVAIFRMILALPLGLAAGMGAKFISNIIKIFNIYFTAIPMLIFSFIILNIGYFRNLQMDKSILAFAIVLTIVGWSKLAGIIEDSTRLVMEEDFIEGEIAIGKTRWQIAYQNVLPHILPTSVSLFFKEMGMALFLIAQLAVLCVFVGVTRKIKELAFKANYQMNAEPEWGGTLSRIAINVKAYKTTYWMTIYPILVFSIAIIGINLTGEGLRIEFQKRESRVISSIRKLFYVVSPKIFISQIKEVKKYYKPVIIKTSIIIGLIAYVIIPWHPSTYKFDLSQAKVHLEELTNDKYKGRVAGTNGGYLAGEYIIDTLKSYGYEVDTLEIPLMSTKKNPTTNVEVVGPEILAPMVIKSGWIKLINDNGEEKIYRLHKDFTIETVSKNIFTHDSKEELNYKGVAADAENAGVIPEGTEFFSVERNFEGFEVGEFKTPNIVKAGPGKNISYDIKFILDEGYNTNNNSYMFKYTAILPFDDLREQLEMGYREVEINFDYPILPEHKGRNITAFLPGKDKTYEEPGELIIIGASYDGVHISENQSPYVMTATPAATALEVARQLSIAEEPLSKSIQFVFWDNEYEMMKYSNIDGSRDYSITKGIPVDMAMSHGYYYFDISYPGYVKDKYLNLITFPAQRADKSNYLMGLEIEKRFKQMDVKYKRFHNDYTTTRAMYYLRLNAFSCIGVGNPSIDGINSSIDTIGNINYEKMESIGQIILDTMTMNSHIMD